MGERWRYSWVGELLSTVWWFLNVGAAIAIAYWIPWIALQFVSLLVLQQLWGVGSRLIQRQLPFPDDKPEWPGCLVFIIGLCAIAVLNLK
jgi:hypothetical protein